MADDITRAPTAGQLLVPMAPPYPLDDIAAAHQAVESGSRKAWILGRIS